MKHVNVALFVPDAGCPHRCSFCNQKTISGKSRPISAADVKEAAETALKSGKDLSGGEIAFFGGSFTGIDRAYMDELLDAAYEYVKNGFFKGIRVSTRPDYIDDEILIHLKKYGVTAIELGCQSVDDEVLRLNGRGHTAKDIREACSLIERHGIELGVQMMTGLYGDSDRGAKTTAKCLAGLKPKTARIYPTIVLEGTYLAELYEEGKYVPQTLDEAVELCSELLMIFGEKGVKVIRLGLHSGGNVEEGYIAGPYHPAFAELCKSRIYFKKTMEAFRERGIDGGAVSVEVSSKYISQFLGQKKGNISKFAEAGYTVRAVPRDGFNEYDIVVNVS